MGLERVPSGKDLPNDFNVIIEIPMHSDPVKYEVDKDSGAIFVDRFMSTAMHYPCNYGYIPHTIAGDGDPVDVLVVTPFALPPGSVVRCRPLGMPPTVILGPGEAAMAHQTDEYCRVDALVEAVGLYEDLVRDAEDASGPPV